MIINFRQGIVSYPTNANGIQQFLIPSGSSVTLSATNGVTDVAFAHRTANYLHTETTTTPNAWGSLPAYTVVWLYWDINNLTGERTFGYTELEPVTQNSPPSGTLEADQHWFDTTINIMKVWTGSRWQEKIRVFAAEYDTGSNTFISVSVNSNTQQFTGTQVGIQGESVAVGRIIVDNVGMPITNRQNLFFTTEDDFFINGSPINVIRLEANILTARAGENIAAYQIVKFTQFGEVLLASYGDLENSAIAIAMQDVLYGDIGSFVIQGIITNAAWNWSSVGTKLWIDAPGILSEYDPHTNDVVNWPVGKAPVGRVIGQHSIVFDQGLGLKGDKGESALSTTGSDAATTTSLGKVKLTVDPTDPGSPYVVETNDPRMSDARPPLTHQHTASQVIPATFGACINGTLQTTLENLDTAKLNQTGGTMTGELVLNGTPSNGLAAVPKNYVDTFVPLSQRGASNGIATLDSTGKITQSQLPQLSITDTFVVDSETAMLALGAQTGDVCVRSDIHTTYILKGPNPYTRSDWQELLTKPDGVMSVDVQVPLGKQGLTTHGGPVTSTGTIYIELADDIAAIENLTGTGVAHRTGTNTWAVKQVDLGDMVTGTLSVTNGGTGYTSVNGYLKGNGTSYTVLTSIPASDVVGTVSSATSVNWTGVTNTPNTVSGYGIVDAYTKTEVNNLTWNWDSITNAPTLLSELGLTDVYNTSQVDNFLLLKANKSTTLAGYGITDAAPIVHSHTLDSLQNVNTAAKVNGSLLTWSGTQWSTVSVDNALIPATLSNKTIDSTCTITVKDTMFYIYDDVNTSKRARFEASSIPTSTTNVYTLPEVSGTLALTNGYGATGNWNINASTASSVNWSGIVGAPTTLAGYGITDVYSSTDVENLSWDWSSITNTPTTLAGYGITNAYTVSQVDSKTWNWSSITNTPTTLVGYGITDTYSAATIDAKTWDWTSITNVPTTVAGYGITDAVDTSMLAAHDHDTVYVKLSQVGTSVASLDANGLVPITQLPAASQTHVYHVGDTASMLALPATQGDFAIRTDTNLTYILTTDMPTQISDWVQIQSHEPDEYVGTVTSVALVSATSGITVGSGVVTAAGTMTIDLAGDLAGLEGLTDTGFAVRTGDGVWIVKSSVETTELSGVLSINQGGTGASDASTALLNLGGVPFNGTGATGDWDINITGDCFGNASTVTNGVYTNVVYDNPDWLGSISPDKVVGAWTGSTSIDTVSSALNFGSTLQARNITAFTDSTTPQIVDAINLDEFLAGKYLVYATCELDNTVMMVDAYVMIRPSNEVYFSQTGTGDEILQLTAVYNSGTNSIDVILNPNTASAVDYRISGMLMRA